jgi:hypothetical protein
MGCGGGYGDDAVGVLWCDEEEPFDGAGMRQSSGESFQLTEKVFVYGTKKSSKLG